MCCYGIANLVAPITLVPHVYVVVFTELLESPVVLYSITVIAPPVNFTVPSTDTQNLRIFWIRFSLLKQNSQLFHVEQTQPRRCNTEQITSCLTHRIIDTTNQSHETHSR